MSALEEPVFASPGTEKRKGKKARKSAVLEASSAAPASSPNKKRKLEDVAAPPVVEDSGESAVEEGSPARQTKAEKGKDKKRKKEQAKALENPPAFSFDTRGFKGGRVIAVKDVRDFVLHLLSDEKAQQWLYVANKRNIRRVVVVMIPGIVPATLGVPAPSLASNMPFALTLPPLAAGTEASTSQLPIFQTLFSHACPTKAPGEKNKMHSCYQAFTTCPLTGGEKDRREKARKEKGQAEKSLDATAYLLSTELMMEHAYPVPSPHPSPLPDTPATGFAAWTRKDGWIEAPWQKKQAYGTKRVLGIDCEMCLTEDGSELTRVSVVDSKGTRVYDSLVKPDKPITDYLTRYSGMTAEKLANVTTRLVDIQAKLAELIDYHTILIGHSLECDLRVLKLIHPWVIDTSVIYQHPRGPPFKASLKWLAQKWLKREIQNAIAGSKSIGGHDSEEDARTCIDLLNLKLQKGPGFGEFVNDQETIFERMERGPEPKVSAVVDHGTPGQWHGAKAQTAIARTNDDEVLQGMLDSIEGHDFTIGRFMDLSHALSWSQPSNAALGRGSAILPGVPASLVAASTPSGPAQLSTIYSTLNERIATLHAALPPLTALVIFTGHGDPQEMARLAAKKANFDRLWKTVKQSEIVGEDRWLEEDDRALLDEVERCRAGLSFYCMK